MRIISKFHDYYDIGLSYGVDPEIVYVRKTEKINIDYTSRSEKTELTKQIDIAKKVFSKFREDGFNCVKPTRRNYSLDHLKLLINSFGCICFCGYVYPFIECKINLNRYKKFKYIYLLDDLDNLIENSKNKRIYNWYYNKTKQRYYEINRKHFKDFFNGCEKMPYNDLVDLHLYYDSPIFMYERGYDFTIIKNPKLDEVEFYQIQDSYTAFQNLSMFMSGILGVKQNETLDVSDKNLKHMKGFDEGSFRKEPTKRK